MTEHHATATRNGDANPQTAAVLREIFNEDPLKDYTPKQALHSFVRGFSVAFAIREGITLVLRLITVLRKKGVKKLFSFERILSEKGAVNRVEAVRLGLAVGGFTGGYKLLYWLLGKFTGPERNQWNSVISGSALGLCLLFQEKSVRRIIALYAITRTLQCLYNQLKEYGWFNFWWTGKWNDKDNIGDSLLFILASAQVMYAYVMRPDTLPSSYYKFIVRSGPIDEFALECVRKANRGLPIDLEKVAAFCIKKGGKIPEGLTALPAMLGCNVLHPGTTSCTGFCLKSFLGTARKTLPLYATLTFVPLVVLQFRRLFGNPVATLLAGGVSCLRSTVFLATFVFLYQVVICIQRNLVSRDHRVIYYIAGLVSSCSILIEKKSRRSELALYVLPRAVDSLYTLLLDRKWMAQVPNFEVALFCMAMGGLMHFYTHAPSTMSPALRFVFGWLLEPKKV